MDLLISDIALSNSAFVIFTGFAVADCSLKILD